MIRIGVVSEGKTDQIVLKTFLSKAIDNLSDKSLINIQPNPDRTSAGNNEDGGWRNVFSWCEKYSKKTHRRKITQGGLFQNSQPYNAPIIPMDTDHSENKEVQNASKVDPGEFTLSGQGITQDGFLQSSQSYNALIIHMDTDHCENKGFQNVSKVDPEEFTLSNPVDRGKYVEAVLADWLWPDGHEGNDHAWIILAPAVEAIETWLLAGLTDESQPEGIKKPVLALLTWDYDKRKQPMPPNAKKMSKTPERYKKFANQAAKNIDNVKEKCPHFAALVKKIKPLTLGVHDLKS